jgi:hypothetical protein
MEPESLSYQAIHEALLRYDDMEVTRRLQMVMNQEEIPEQPEEVAPKKSDICLVS